MSTDKQTYFARRWFKPGLLIVGWTIIGCFYAARNIVVSVSQGRPIEWSRIVLYEIIYWQALIILTPIILWLVRRFPINRENWARRLFVLIFFGLLLSPVQGLIESGVALFIEWGIRQTPNDELAQRFPIIVKTVIVSCFTGFVTYWLIVGVFYASEYYRKFREREIIATQLENRLAQAELQNLKMQLHPHFLFNTLHTISILITRDAKTAKRMLIHLSDLLRITLDNSGAQEVSLKQEIEFLERYLEIEQTRFQDRLTVKTNVDAKALEARVPNLILQPLVENAIRHGIGRSSKKGIVELSAEVEDETLHLSVRDNGSGFSEGEPKNGVGIANTKARLNQLYGDAHRFEMTNLADGGAFVKIEIPFRTEKSNG
ncbi:MAG TPA: histidine kinase [Pyrinomonadaceae bacterium]